MNDFVWVNKLLMFVFYEFVVMMVVLEQERLEANASV